MPDIEPIKFMKFDFNCKAEIENKTIYVKVRVDGRWKRVFDLKWLAEEWRKEIYITGFELALQALRPKAVKQ